MSQESRHCLVGSSATGYSHGVDQGKIHFKTHSNGCWQESSLSFGMRVLVPRWLLVALCSLPNGPFHDGCWLPSIPCQMGLSTSSLLHESKKLRNARETKSKTAQHFNWNSKWHSIISLICYSLEASTRSNLFAKEGDCQGCNTRRQESQRDILETVCHTGSNTMSFQSITFC